MSIKKKVAVVFTGGTISMTIDPELGAAIPSLSGEEILSLATNINKVATIEGHNFDEIPSPHMTFEKLMELKQYFNTKLNNYMLEKRRKRKYIPHATLCTSDTLDKSIQLANQKFNPFISTIKYIWVYNRDMQLIKEYNLK